MVLEKDSKKLREEYQRLHHQAHDFFMTYLKNSLERYAVYKKGNHSLNVARTLERIGVHRDNSNMVTNWESGKTDPLRKNNSREHLMDIFMKFHLYEFELEEGQDLSFESVSEAYDSMLVKLNLNPLYVFNPSDFCVLLAMKLQNYDHEEPLNIFINLYKNFKTYENMLDEALPRLSQSQLDNQGLTDYIDVTQTAFRDFIRINELGNEQADAFDQTNDETPVTAYQFIQHYVRSFNRVRITPYLILSECFSGRVLNWEFLRPSQLDALKEENTDKAENLSKDDANYPAGALPKETVQIIKTFVKCLEYGKTLSRSNMILFCALFLSRSKCRGIIGNEGRKALWEYFNDVILNPCGYAPMDLEHPKSPEEFAVMTAIINADLKAEYPLGEYICKTFLECDYSYVRDPITVACFAR